MGIKDITTRQLEECNDVFADIINVLVFKGERRVFEDDLADLETKSVFVADEKGLRFQDRDVSKFWTTQKIRLALFGLENQSNPDSTMPLRIYSYNGASYKAQIVSDRKNKRDVTCSETKTVCDEEQGTSQSLYPVLTLVLYFGLKRWNTAKTLYEAVNIPDEMKRFIPDLSINLVEVAWLEDDVIDKFKSDFNVVAKFFKHLRLRGDINLDLNDPLLSLPITHFLELMRLLSAYSGDPRFEASAQMLPPEKERNMLAVLTKLEEQGRCEGRKEGRIEGRKEGRKEGTNNLNRVYSNLLMQGRKDDLIRSINDPEYLKKIMAEFGYSDDEDLDEEADV